MNYSTRLVCSWAGCGAQFTRRVIFAAHTRSHTGEKVIACYHCGRHYARNRKLTEHILRQVGFFGLHYNRWNQWFLSRMPDIRYLAEYYWCDDHPGHLTLFSINRFFILLQIVMSWRRDFHTISLILLQVGSLILYLINNSQNVVWSKKFCDFNFDNSIPLLLVSERAAKWRLLL